MQSWKDAAMSMIAANNTPMNIKVLPQPAVQTILIPGQKKMKNSFAVSIESTAPWHNWWGEN